MSLTERGDLQELGQPAQQLVNGHAQGFALDVPQRQVQRSQRVQLLAARKRRLEELLPDRRAAARAAFSSYPRSPLDLTPAPQPRPWVPRRDTPAWRRTFATSASMQRSANLPESSRKPLSSAWSDACMEA